MNLEFLDSFTPHVTRRESHVTQVPLTSPRPRASEQLPCIAAVVDVFDFAVDSRCLRFFCFVWFLLLFLFFWFLPCVWLWLPGGRKLSFRMFCVTFPPPVDSCLKQHKLHKLWFLGIFKKRGWGGVYMHRHLAAILMARALSLLLVVLPTHWFIAQCCRAMNSCAYEVSPPVAERSLEGCFVKLQRFL